MYRLDHTKGHFLQIIPEVCLRLECLSSSWGIVFFKMLNIWVVTLIWGEANLSLAWLMSCRSGVVEDIGWERDVLVSHSGSLWHTVTLRYSFHFHNRLVFCVVQLLLSCILMEHRDVKKPFSDVQCFVFIVN